MFQIRSILKTIRRCIPFGGIPYHRNEEIKPTFIVGSGRSGNTLLRRILTAQTGLHIPPETYVLGDIIKSFELVCKASWNNNVQLILSKLEYHPEFKHFNITLRDLANELYLIPENSRSLAIILNSFYLYHAKKCGIICNRWGDKTPLNTFALNEIHSVFPKASFINMLRNPYDVVLSYMNSGIYKDLESAAHRWADSVKLFSTFSARHLGQCLTVKYEDLVTKPYETTRIICKFLELNYVDAMVSNTDHITKMGDVGQLHHHEKVKSDILTQNIGKASNAFSRAEKKDLNNVFKGLLEETGYSILPED